MQQCNTFFKLNLSASVVFISISSAFSTGSSRPSVQSSSAEMGLLRIAALLDLWAAWAVPIWGMTQPVVYLN